MGESLTVELAELPDRAATEALGGALARALRGLGETGCLILLQGELGAGKTTLVRGLLRAAGHTGPVPSPTYTLVEPYEIDGQRLFHLDLYRIADAQELEYLGWRDMEGAISLVEWPERAPDLAAAADLVIRLTHADAGRRARIEAVTPTGAILAGAMEQTISHFK
ncbi:tRNA (adenosine(37)-N6)-threonylcarbamoyltransferase complex ATPase subunit type 1 TsaE [Lentisalinibacter salinarum]|uniref:tRNA (adenosine(37)-N6)-threonylcarbamoyltransferase complex ATPase subunit type 1 TsaE n=1 Tax=Lentisalinibacter salinarum TaxID=2992239 RepID=UPI00386B170E